MQIENPPEARPSPADHLFVTDAARPLSLLARCPAYAPTPLRDIPALGRAASVSRLWVKDETGRMGLGSFKALGGAFAVAQMIADAAGVADPSRPEAKRAAGKMTFITASAGNHGLSVAAGARMFGARAVIVLPESAPESFAGRIRALGADLRRASGDYEFAVEHAKAEAARTGWLLLADGSWEGYVERPALVMEGYTVIAEECRAAFEAGGQWPTHVYLQAGVGGLAAAMAAHVRNYWSEQPELIVVEPDSAPCLLRSVENGRLTRAEGPASNMGRLDCKDASLIAYQTLRQTADRFLTVSDAAALEAAAICVNHGLATTPSGAAALAALLAAPPGPEARCLLIASEGPETI
ncbi:MAG: diaminopropionate ammonia-lyase [Paracoccaceae bacterium]